jgi:hypothetical protein
LEDFAPRREELQKRALAKEAYDTLDRKRSGRIGVKLAEIEEERQGLTLVHFSAQPEPFLTQNTP